MLGASRAGISLTALFLGFVWFAFVVAASRFLNNRTASCPVLPDFLASSEPIFRLCLYDAFRSLLTYG